MKKILLLCGAFLLTMNASFASCRCGEPKFTSQDEVSAIENFVENKLENGVVQNISLIETLPVARYNSAIDPMRTYPRRYRTYNSHYRGWVDEEFMGFEYRQVGMSKCEVECANKENSIKKYDVEYVSGNKNCSVNVKVYMTSTLFGFKSMVKQKLAPVCE